MRLQFKCGDCVLRIKLSSVRTKRLSTVYFISVFAKARNSILMSGFPDSDKSSWLGPKFFMANDPLKSGIPQIRAQVWSDLSVLCFI
jgi:hypothetical protein